MNRALIVLLSVFTSLSLIAAQGFSSLEEQMSGKEFTGAGLDKLSEQELASLNQWIRDHSLGSLQSPTTVPVASETGESRTTDRRGLPSERDEDRTTITSRLVGTFTGWDGQTTFRLENGMIWIQADKDKFYTKELVNPVVVIEPGMFSRWFLHIEGFEDDCKVKRIQ